MRSDDARPVLACVTAVPGNAVPDGVPNGFFVTAHCPWNHSRKIGFCVTIVTLAGEKALRYKPFAEGRRQGESAWGGPADAPVAPDGSLLMADDTAGAIDWISYRGQ